VRDLTTKFGKNAEKIWVTLNKKGLLEEKELIKITKLKDREVYSAIGWLARESKIYREGEDYYKLENTNLTPEIGANAGKVWDVLNVWGEVDVPMIKRLAEMEEREIYSALGKLMKYNLK
jgi:hypothetical protein